MDYYVNFTQKPKVRENGPFKGAACRLPDAPTVYDVIIAGAGPAGACCAYYLSQYSRGVYAGTNLRIALLEKATFPRDKYCGDAWCKPALDILEEMGVLQELEADGLVCDCLCGGFVSPAGHSFIANDRDTPSEEKNMSTRCYAIKRKICDERIARKAASCPGVELIESARVSTTSLDKESGIWAVCTTDGRTFTSRVLVAADGAASNIARSLGIVKDAPQAVAARRYVKPGKHNFKGDGVLLYPDYTLPGYAALFRHYDDSIDLGLYLLPGGTARDSDLSEIYEKKLMTDPFVSRALGPNVEFSERLKVASLRLGGVERSYDDHILLVGDAAGQVDPLTGEGIHTGMEGAKLAAETIAEMFRQGDFSAESGKAYHHAWWKAFGADFPLSDIAGRLVFKLPFLMDAVPKASQGKGGKAGADFFADFGAVMTGAKPKSTFLLPSVAIPLAMETMKQFVFQHVLKNERSYYTPPETLKDRELSRVTSWDAQCLIDPNVTVSELSMEPGDKALSDIFKFADDRLPAVLVLYGTEYGFSRDLAMLLCQQIADVSCARCLNLAQAEAVVEWDKETTVFVVCSTAGDGDPPVEARAFFDFLASGAISLKHIQFSILGPGDTAYPKFAQASIDLRQRFLDVGAKECVPLFTLETDDAEEAKPWLDQCASVKIVPSAGGGGEEENYLRENVRANAELFTKVAGATKQDPFVATLSNKHMLTELVGDDPKETWHVEIDISNADGLVDYLPGDALGVQPLNDPALVEEILELLAEDVSNKSLFEKLSECDLQHSLKDLKSDDQEHVIDVLLRLGKNTLKEDGLGKKLLQKLKPLQPRYYSIASCLEKDKGSVHLCIAAVRYSSLNRSRSGVASTYLIDRVQVGDPVRVWVQRNPDFRAIQDTPVLMVGPGTGVAPFRAFIRSWDKEADVPSRMLFFGCRSEKQDFLYATELQNWAARVETNELVTAFSRDQSQKVYVQHKMEQHGEKIWKDILNCKEGQVFICGEGFYMANDVKDMLYSIATKYGDGINSKEDAIEMLQNRIHLDVWVT